MCTIEALNPIAASGGARFFKRELFNCSIYKRVPRSASAHKLSCSASLVGQPRGPSGAKSLDQKRCSAAL